MFAYIDETGNSGRNIFDPDQPIFMTAALMTKRNFDMFHMQDFKNLASTFGDTCLHANILGMGRIEEISAELLKIVKRNNVRLFISRIEKNYLVVSKFVDTLFDTYENPAVPWSAYNLRVLRLMLVFKTASILNEEIVLQFWDALLEKNQDKAYAVYVDCLGKLQPRVKMIPDQRSREIFNDAIDWVIKHPKSISLHTGVESIRRGHLPNMAAFPELLRGIERQSQLWNSKVFEIKHDRQSQFESLLKDWHDVYSKASPEPIHWPGDDPYVVQRVKGSTFTISSAEDSAGIQLVDIVMWLYKKAREDKYLPQGCRNLMHVVLKNSHMMDLSFETVHEAATQNYDELMAMDISDDKIEAAKKLVKEDKARRNAIMQKIEAESSKKALEDLD